MAVAAVVVVIVAVAVLVPWADAHWDIRIFLPVDVVYILAGPFCIVMRLVGVEVAGTNSLQPMGPRNGCGCGSGVACNAPI